MAQEVASGETRQQTKVKKKLTLKKVLLAVAIVIIVLLIATAVGISLLLKSVAPSPGIHYSGKPSLGISLMAQSLLLYDNATQAVPYSLFSYGTKNITNLVLSTSISGAQPDKYVYILNTSNECIGCTGISAFQTDLSEYLVNYTIFNSTNQLRLMQPSASAVASIPGGSVLIVPNGYLPDFLVSENNGTTPLQTLMQDGVTVIYIGQNFSRLISAQSVLIPSQNIPEYLETGAFGPVPRTSLFFNTPSFQLINGVNYGALSYVNVENGHIVAFSNYLSSWPSPQDAAHDIATAIFQQFWLPTLTHGTSTINLNSNSTSGLTGIILNGSLFTYSKTLPQVYSSAYGRLVVTGSNDAFSSPSGTFYKILYFKPQYTINGTLGIPPTLFPGGIITAAMTIFTNKTISVEPHIDIYSQNMTHIQSFAPFFSKTINGTYSFFNTFTILLPAGTYIAQLNGFSNQNYASSVFYVPAVFFSLLNVNATQGTYLFSTIAEGLPVSNVAANVTLNGKYKQTVAINNGQFTFTLPLGASLITGNLTFSINVLNQVFTYRTNYSPPALVINKQYIEFIAAIIIVILEITLVKAPTRDDFYVDVPNIPEPQKTQIKVKSAELTNVFDKLNLSYHWRFMPLSNTEFRFAISNNIRVNNLPVTLTYDNIDVILDSMTSKGYLVSIDNLYAPKVWLEQSKHDIEYLATFKKMRIYLVSHAHIFTDLDRSEVSDIVTTLHNEKAYIIIWSKTSKFVKTLPVQPPTKTYIVFLNAYKLEEFRNELYTSTSMMIEELKMYMSTGSVVLLDADNPEGLPT